MDKDVLIEEKKYLSSTTELLKDKISFSKLTVNNEKYNSKEYFTQIAKYKTVMANLKRAIAKVNTYEIDVKENELKDREHWLWSFYVNVKHNIDKNEFEKFVKMTDEDVKYHIEIGE